jgi:hypothetical protein
MKLRRKVRRKVRRVYHIEWWAQRWYVGGYAFTKAEARRQRSLLRAALRLPWKRTRIVLAA